MNKIINSELYDFDSLKHIYDNYEIRNDRNNNLVAVNINTGEYTYKEKIIDKVKFSNLWFLSTMYERSRESLNLTQEDYNYAFNEGAKSTYNHLMYSVQNQIKNYGEVNSIELFEIVNKTNYKYTKSILEFLIKNQRNYEILNKWIKNAFIKTNSIEKNKMKIK